MRTPGLILGFRGLKSSSNFGDSCFLLDFGTTHVALFNGLVISDIWILVLFMFIVYYFARKPRDRSTYTNLCFAYDTESTVWIVGNENASILV